MSNDKFRDEKIGRAGYRAGATGRPKSANPYRGMDNEDEHRWDRHWEEGSNGKEFTGSE